LIKEKYRDLEHVRMMCVCGKYVRRIEKRKRRERIPRGGGVHINIINRDSSKEGERIWGEE